MKQLNEREFGYLAGTDLMISMLRNRLLIGYDIELITDVCNYLDINGMGLFHHSGGMFYFEEVMDLNAISSFLPEKDK